MAPGDNPKPTTNFTEDKRKSRPSGLTASQMHPELYVPLEFTRRGLPDVKSLAFNLYIENYLCINRAGGSGERVKIAMEGVLSQLTEMVGLFELELGDIAKYSKKMKEAARVDASLPKHSIYKRQYLILVHDLRLSTCDLGVVVTTLKVRLDEERAAVTSEVTSRRCIVSYGTGKPSSQPFVLA